MSNSHNTSSTDQSEAHFVSLYPPCEMTFFLFSKLNLTNRYGTTKELDEANLVLKYFENTYSCTRTLISLTVTVSLANTLVSFNLPDYNLTIYQSHRVRH